MHKQQEIKQLSAQIVKLRSQRGRLAEQMRKAHRRGNTRMAQALCDKANDLLPQMQELNRRLYELNNQ